MKICKTEGCDGKLCARDFCVKCYYKEIRRGNITTQTQTKKWIHRITDIDEVNKQGTCANCGRVKILNRGNGNWRCSVPSNHRAKLYKQAYRQVKKNQLLDYCEICGSKEKLCWDHNHKTNEFRGTLCGKCNAAIGMFQENTQFIENAIKYLNERSPLQEE